MPQTLQARPATVADIPLIRSLAETTWMPTYVPIIGAAQVAYMLQRFYAPHALQQQMEQGHTFIICLLGGQPVGFASWGPAEPGRAKLHKLYVLPATQGSGAGRYMVHYITDALHKAGYSALRLNVNRHNAAAIRFYQKAGFSLLYEEDIDIEGGFFMNDYVLELPIPQT